MRLPARDTLEKTLFVLGVAVLAFQYGYGARGFGWFPDSLIARAWHQAQDLAPRVTQLFRSPGYLTSRVYDREGVRLVQPDRYQPGLTLIATVWRWPDEEWSQGLKLIDRDGETIHQWRIDPRDLFPDSLDYRTDAPQYKNLMGSHLFANGDVVVNLSYVGTARLDACGDVRWRMAEANHHSVVRASDGSFWTPAITDAQSVDRFPGLSGEMHVDRLLRFSADGKILDDVNVLEVLYQNGLERHIPQVNREKTGDLTHLNDVEPLSPSMADEYPLFEAGDLAVSLRSLNLILVLDPESRKVRWHESRPWIAQHDPDFIGDGWIGVFDNNRDDTESGEMLGGSRIVAVRPADDETRVLFPTPESEPFYTAYGGKWQALENGNLLLTETYAGRVVEVAEDGTTVWEWVGEPYDESSVPEVAKARRYDLDPSQVASWPCSQFDSPG